MQPPTLASAQFKRMAAAIEYLYDHAAQQPDLNEVAAHVHISPHHLQRQFSQWVGISPKKLLQYISIGQAKQRLQQQASLSQAAHDSGLSGTGRLHDLFVRIEGMTPGEYKNGAADLRIAYAFAPTPFGEVLVAATATGVCFMAFADERTQALADLAAEYPAAELAQEASPLHARALAVFGGSVPGSVPLHLKGSPFQLKVWQALLQIPAGCLKSYGDIAAAIGQTNAARAVGSAVAANPVAVLIPCHRVIRESGIIGGYRWQRGRKMAMLGWEMAQQERVNAG